MTRADQERQQRLHEKLRRELGPEVLGALEDPDVTEVMLNPDGRLWVESRRDGMRDTGGRMTGIQAESLIGTVASMLGRVVHAGLPILEGELPLDGNRFEGILPPVSTAPVFVIRKQAGLVWALDDYVGAEILAPWQAEVLRQTIRSRQNVLIAGGTASGKTTLANALLREMVALGDPAERFVILEDTRELRCAAPNAVQLRTGDLVDLTRLTRVTMRLRPDRIVVGEVRGPEALALLKAWNTGHPGGLTTVHANSARAALMRLEALVEEAGVPAQPRLVAEALDLVVFIARTARGRRVQELAKVEGWDPALGYRLGLVTGLSTEDPHARHESALDRV
jgi:type IV secretion system protein TrbB